MTIIIIGDKNRIKSDPDEDVIIIGNGNTIEQRKAIMSESSSDKNNKKRTEKK